MKSFSCIRSLSTWDTSSSHRDEDFRFRQSLSGIARLDLADTTPLPGSEGGLGMLTICQIEI